MYVTCLDHCISYLFFNMIETVLYMREQFRKSGIMIQLH